MRWLLPIALLLCINAVGTDFYVSHHASASDGNGGTNATTDAWATIQKGVDTVNDPDRLLIVDDSTYTPGAVINVDAQAGTHDSRITVIGANSSGVADGSSYPTIDIAGNDGFIRATLGQFYDFRYLDFIASGASFRAAFTVGHSWNILDCTYTTSGDSSSFSDGSLNSTFKRITAINTHATPDYAAIVSSSSDMISDCKISGFDIGIIASNARDGFSISNCTIFDNDTAGIWINGQSPAQGGGSIVNCLVYENDDGIFIDEPIGSLLIAFCTIADNGGDGLDITTDAEGLVLIQNSIFSNNGGGGGGGYDVELPATHAAGPTVREFANTFYNAVSGDFSDLRDLDSDSLTSDPDFVDDTNATLADRDYTLNASSPVIQKLFTNTNDDDSYPTWGAYTPEITGGGGTVIIIMED